MDQLHPDPFQQAVVVFLTSLHLAGRQPEAWLSALELAFATPITADEARDWVTRLVGLQN